MLIYWHLNLIIVKNEKIKFSKAGVTDIQRAAGHKANHQAAHSFFVWKRTTQKTINDLFCNKIDHWWFMPAHYNWNQASQLRITGGGMFTGWVYNELSFFSAYDNEIIGELHLLT